MSYLEKLHAAAVERRQELLELASALIRIPSENPTGEQKTIIRFIQDYLSKAGIKSEIAAANPDFPCLVAQLGSQEGPCIILNGHADVVPAGSRSGWKFDPFCGTITGTKILGRGASDMKSGLAGILFAMKLFAESDVPMKGSLRLHVVTDEESGGQYGTSWLCSQGYADGAAACLVAEPTSCSTIEIGQKGILHVTLRAHGKPAHGSLGNFAGDNAILKLARVLIHIDDLLKVSGNFAPEQATALKNSKIIVSREVGIPGAENVIDHLTANVGLISGGTKINMVPDACEAQIDLRLPIGVKRSEVETAVVNLIRDSGVVGVEPEFEWAAEPNFTDDRCDIVQIFKKNAEVIWNREVLPAYQWASSDAKYYRELGIPTIQYGPSNTEGIHSYNEDVDCEDVAHAGEIYVMSLCELLGLDSAEHQ